MIIDLFEGAAWGRLLITRRTFVGYYPVGLGDVTITSTALQKTDVAWKNQSPKNTAGEMIAVRASRWLTLYFRFNG